MGPRNPAQLLQAEAGDSRKRTRERRLTQEEAGGETFRRYVDRYEDLDGLVDSA